MHTASRSTLLFCGITQPWTNHAAAFSPHPEYGPDHGTGCASRQVSLECATSAALLLCPCCPLSTAPGPQGLHLTRGLTIIHYHKPLSPFVAVLAPVPRNPHSGSEAPRGPYPGTGHRNRTIFSSGQAEALEKGARAGADSGSEGICVTHEEKGPEACGQRLRWGGYGWPCLGEEGVSGHRGGEGALIGRHMPCPSPCARTVNLNLCRVPASEVS